MTIQPYLDDLTLAGKRPGTIARYREAVTAWLASGQSASDFLTGYLRRARAEELSLSRYNGVRSAIRSYMAFAGINEPMPPRVKIEGKIKPGRALTAEDTQLLVDTFCQDERQNAADRAAVYLLWSSGIRRCELVGAMFEDLNLRQRQLDVQGKGGNWRRVPFDDETARLLRVMLLSDRPKAKGKGVGRLFLGQRGGEYDPKLLVAKVRKAAAAAGMESVAKNLRPVHLFRVNCATQMLENGASMEQVQDLLGHENQRTTKIYAAMSPKKLHEAHSNYHPLAQRQDERERETA